MGLPGARGPIIIPIPLSHVKQIDTTVATQPTILRIGLEGAGWDFYKNTIFPYIWQGYQVRIRCATTRTIPTQARDIMKTKTFDFIVRGNSATQDDITNGVYGLFITLPSTNTQTNGQFKFTTSLYTENGVDYSYYSYVIYP